jgi:hypothetical protein
MVGYKRFLIITGCILCICVFQTVTNISHYSEDKVGVLYKTMKNANLYESRAVNFTVENEKIMEEQELHDDLPPIRKWGCSPRNETPFIFVHIGKAGGGGVRARIAASALDYNRKKWQLSGKDNKHYYPIPSESGDTIYKGKFLNSNLPNFRNMYQRNSSKTDLISQKQIEAAQKKAKTFEGSLPCAAETPLGGALACPAMPSTMAQHKTYCSFSTGIRCDIIYVGHNFLGSEWHWLPHKYLGNWWKKTPWYKGSNDRIMEYLDHRWTLWTSKGNNESCIYSSTPTRKSSLSSSNRASRLMNQPHHLFYNQHYYRCIAPYEEEADNEGIKAMSATHVHNCNDWSVIHASLPVLRVTVLREPFSWLVSKFFWHLPKKSTIGGYMNAGPGIGNVEIKSCDEPYQNNKTEWKNLAGWASRLGRSYLYVLCGEDCLVRNSKGHLTLSELERQAANNLRQSFAVVGLLHETNTFYDMITARVSYMNMSLNPHVQGDTHSTGNTAEIRRCKKVYQNSVFQEELLKRSPELAALQRVYNVGVEVNQAQKNELQQCGLLQL